MKTSISCALVALAAKASASLVNGIYYDQYHTTNLPGPNATAGINHVYIAFVDPLTLTTWPFGDYRPFETVENMKAKFGNDTKVLISIGGWGSDFTSAAANASSRALFAQGCNAVLNYTQADGVDIDWEYPGGNGADYKIVPNSEKTSEIETYPLLLEAIRSEIGEDKLLTIAVPGKTSDMIAYTAETVPRIAAVVDYFNLMTYDFMNRRDNVTKHHTDVQGSLETVDAYLSRGLPAKKAILGFAYYAKWFTTAANSSCPTGLGCATVAMEDDLGADNGKSGAFTFEASNMVITPVPTNLTIAADGACGLSSFQKCGDGNCCSTSGYCGSSDGHCGVGCQVGYGVCASEFSLAESWQLAAKNGLSDDVAGGQYYFDSPNNIFWTWDTPKFIAEKFTKIVNARGLGGVMAWSLGEDTYDNSHMYAVQAGVRNATSVKSTRSKSIKQKQQKKQKKVVVADKCD